MSLANALSTIKDLLQHVSQPVRDKILKGAAKLEALEDLTANQILRRNSRRLHQTTKAVRKHQGIDLPDDPDDEIVLGDKTTNQIGVAGALAFMLAAALLALGMLGGAWLLRNPGPVPETPAAPVDTDTTIKLQGRLVEDEQPPPEITPP